MTKKNYSSNQMIKRELGRQLLKKKHTSFTKFPDLCIRSQAWSINCCQNAGEITEDKLGRKMILCIFLNLTLPPTRVLLREEITWHSGKATNIRKWTAELTVQELLLAASMISVSDSTVRLISSPVWWIRDPNKIISKVPLTFSGISDSSNELIINTISQVSPWKFQEKHTFWE